MDVKKMTDRTEMEKYKNVIVGAAEFIKDRLYFVTLRTKDLPKSTPSTHYFSIDEELCYENFFHDFGPLNISMLYHYCVKLRRKLKASILQNKAIIHYTTDDPEKRLNSAYLIAAYALLYLDYTPERAMEALETNNTEPFAAFRDASAGCAYLISLLDCLRALEKAYKMGFFNFDSFDYMEYEHYERVENGDLNWIVPEKFLGFCGPHNKSLIYHGYPLHSPETYFNYFRRNNVTTIIRLNKKMYDANKFVNAGFDHKDMYFLDGSTPSDRIMYQFIDICEKAKGAVAVHCKAGLGRTGTLIGCYLMKHYKFTADEAIAWIRICRPGSIIGHQQIWLEGKQNQLWRDGEQYRLKRGIDAPMRHTQGIYNMKKKNNNNNNNNPPTRVLNDNVSGILEKVDTMNINDDNKLENKKVNGSQGDKLNQIKAQRMKTRTVAIPLNDERRGYRARVVVNPASLVRSAKLSVKTTNVLNTRTLAKRNETNESPRRTSQRKLTTTTTTTTVSSNGRPRITTDALLLNNEVPLKTEDSTWTVDPDDTSDRNNTEEEPYSIKRGKRTLNTEKLNNQRSVKVLRRSQAQNSTATVPGKATSKIQLPLVKVAKGI